MNRLCEIYEKDKSHKSQPRWRLHMKTWQFTVKNFVHLMCMLHRKSKSV